MPTPQSPIAQLQNQQLPTVICQLPTKIAKHKVPFALPQKPTYKQRR